MDSLTHTFTIIGVLGGLFFVSFKMLRDDIKSTRAELKEEINGVKSELKEDIGNIRTELKEVRAEVHTLAERVNRMDGQLYQVTQMLYFKPPIHEKSDDIKEN
jgi:predicted nuclease with TOPRIM domain